MLAFLAGQRLVLVAIDACAGAHHWAREIGKFGHTVRLVPPPYAKPFVSNAPFPLLHEVPDIMA
ncbi:transposase (plasmid) [Sinorhizobium meliloti]|nr:transposase [Sinorhizobium meliloti]